MGGMDSEYLPLHAPTGPHPLRAFSPQVLTFMTRHGPFDHSFFAVRFAVRFGATQISLVILKKIPPMASQPCYEKKIRPMALCAGSHAYI